MDWQRFDQHVSGAQRVNAVLDWLRRPADIRPAFVTLYFDIVDTAGHRFGPDSAEVNTAIGEVDARIGDLVAGLAAMREQAHLLSVADQDRTSVVWGKDVSGRVDLGGRGDSKKKIVIRLLQKITRERN